jgi:hypothetical protein
MRVIYSPFLLAILALSGCTSHYPVDGRAGGGPATSPGNTGAPEHVSTAAPKPGAFGLTQPYKPRDPQQGSQVGSEQIVPPKGSAVAPGTNSSSTGE